MQEIVQKLYKTDMNCKIGKTSSSRGHASAFRLLGNRVTYELTYDNYCS